MNKIRSMEAQIGEVLVTMQWSAIKFLSIFGIEAQGCLVVDNFRLKCMENMQKLAKLTKVATDFQNLRLGGFMKMNPDKTELMLFHPQRIIILEYQFVLFFSCLVIYSFLGAW